MEDQEFGEAGMLPKIEASVNFVSQKAGRKAIITSISHALDAPPRQNRHHHFLKNCRVIKRVLQIMKFMMKQHPCSTINVRGSYKKEHICFRYIQVYRKQ